MVSNDLKYLEREVNQALGTITLRMGTKLASPGIEYTPDVCVGGIATASYYEPVETWTGLPLMPSNAFDDNIGTPWGTWPNAAPQWIKYELPSAKVIVRYTITSRGIPSEDPKSWVFQSSNDNSSWITLHTVANQPGWSGQERRIFTFPNTAAYKYYRIHVSANYGGGAVCMAEVEMMELAETFAEETLTHACGANIAYQVSSIIGNNVPLSCPYDNLPLGVNGVEGSIGITNIDGMAADLQSEIATIDAEIAQLEIQIADLTAEIIRIKETLEV